MNFIEKAGVDGIQANVIYATARKKHPDVEIQPDLEIQKVCPVATQVEAVFMTSGQVMEVEGFRRLCLAFGA